MRYSIRFLTAGVALGALLGGAGCSEQASATNVLAFDRPDDITFGCIGAYPTEGEVRTLETAPLSACTVSLETIALGEPDDGTDEEPPEPDPAVPVFAQFAFVLEGVRGTVTVLATGASSGVLDSDPLSPGRNGLPVGQLPVEIATTSNGCQAVTANYGSCDMGVIDVKRAIQQQQNAAERRALTTSAGVLASRPAAIAAYPSIDAVDGNGDPVTCPDSPDSIVYVALPACHLVAVVEVPSGEVIEGIRIDAGGATLTGANPTCPVECPELADTAAAGAVAAGAEPVTLAVEPDGSRLYIGSYGSGDLVVAELDATGTPTMLSELTLEGAGSILRLDASGTVSESTAVVTGNDVSLVSQPAFGAADPRFVYAIADDQTIHVVNVSPGGPVAECDTQIDPRGLLDVTSSDELSCLAPGTAPRRVGVVGPGIAFPPGVVPRDVEFFQQPPPLIDEPLGLNAVQPAIMIGTFVAVPADIQDLDSPSGLLYYINVNDQMYPDYAVTTAPTQIDIGLSQPHSLREAHTDRLQDSLTGCAPLDYQTSEGGSLPGPLRIPQDSAIRVFGLPALNGQVEAYIVNSVLEASDLPGGSAYGERLLLPNLHRVTMECADLPTRTGPVYYLDSRAGTDVRAATQGDLRSISSQSWGVSWEGILGSTGLFPPFLGNMERDGRNVKLTDTQGRLCALGAEQYDIFEIVGCERDAQCALDEVCFIHPDSQRQFGLCFPADQSGALGDFCRDLLISERIYSAVELRAGEASLAPRPYVLPWTPAGNCSDDGQCQALAQDWWDTQAELEVAFGTSPGTWSCKHDVAFGTDKKCVQTCAESTECQPGSVCQTGVCVTGPTPQRACLDRPQAYQVRGSQAFVIRGSSSGYVHRQIADPATGECIEDPSQSELLAGRFTLDEPACVGEGVTATSPNPCSVDYDEPYSLGEPGQVAERPSYGVRVWQPGFSFEIADVVIEHPVLGVLFSPKPSTYQIVFDLVGGFTPFAPELGSDQQGRFRMYVPVRVRRSPTRGLWVVDSGGSTASNGVQGQVMEVVPPAGVRHIAQ